MSDTYTPAMRVIEVLEAIDGDADDLYEQVTNAIATCSEDAKVRRDVFVTLDERPGEYDGGYNNRDWHWKLRRTRNAYGPLFERIEDGQLSVLYECPNRSRVCSPEDPCESCCLDAKENVADRWGWTLPAEDHGVTYTPWTDGHAVGFECAWPNGATTWVYLNPSAIGGAEDERPNVFLYEGSAGDPSQDPAALFIDLDGPD